MTAKQPVFLTEQQRRYAARAEHLARRARNLRLSNQHAEADRFLEQARRLLAKVPKNGG